MREYQFSLDDEATSDFSDEFRQLNLNRRISVYDEQERDGKIPSYRQDIQNTNSTRVVEMVAGVGALRSLPVQIPFKEEELDEVSLNVSVVENAIDISLTGQEFWQGKDSSRNEIVNDDVESVPGMQSDSFFGMKSENADFFLQNIPEKLKNGKASKVMSMICYTFIIYYIIYLIIT